VTIAAQIRDEHVTNARVSAKFAASGEVDDDFPSICEGNSSSTAATPGLPLDASR
jgi:hypothetical protein